MRVNLSDDAAEQGSDAEGDIIESVEILVGSAHGDELRGGSAAETLAGGAGGDLVDGGAGDDALKGGAGADTLVGSSGEDAAVYKGSAAGVSVDLATGGRAVPPRASGCPESRTSPVRASTTH
ncbi:hypothetical protein [Azospirillum sp. TSO35-2]|uniref:hypothetical protein n=1 Tax=Azospirillum sp. TSO35-2 TaxID=716796 RepID=UPI001304DF0A|nr:hypothetical protein [Azospirillum sp. TSO35-2]